MQRLIMQRLSLSVFLATACLFLRAEQKTVCQQSTAGLSCGRGWVIHIDSADYGRSDRTTCSRGRSSNQLQNVHCAASGATDRVAWMCDGKSHCSVTASNSVFDDPCYGTYKYLQVSYSCKCKAIEQKTVCELSTADLTCGLGQVINIDSADYGRHDRTTCSQGRPSEQLQIVNCASSGATNRVAEMCNGKSHCSVRASNSVFGDPCYGTYKYLQVSYSCKCKALARMVSCEEDTVDLSCHSGKVIRIHRADYGRSDRTTCSQGRPSQQLQNMNCAASTANDHVAQM
uniref:SUEL-type lectin domain-containing protein n=1 Tax=Neogobius melanostomus TaxID=47308 RepID=A0A8C6SHB7_9GOBI